MSEQPTSKSATEKLLDELQAAGIQKGLIAKHLDILPSAVTDLYAGRRQLKYDEGINLARLLPMSTQGRKVPVIDKRQALHWQEAIAESQEFLLVPMAVTRIGDFAIQLPNPLIVAPKSVNDAVNLQGNRPFAVIDTMSRSLYDRCMYLIAHKGHASLRWYQTHPAVFEPADGNPFERKLDVGVDEFRVVGTVSAILQGF